jgi:hypothetical protein
MTDDDRDFSSFDPAQILPFRCAFEPHDPTIERLPKVFLPNDPTLYNDTKLF